MSIVVRRFDNLDLQFIPHAEHGFLQTTEQVALGYGRSASLIRKHKSNKTDELLEGKHWVVNIIHTLGGPQEQVLWTRRGVIRLGFFIKSERARRFRDWIEDLVLEEVNNRLAQNNSQLTIQEQILKQYTDFENHYNNRLLNVEKIVLKETKLAARKYQLTKKRAELAFLISNHGITIRSAHARTWFLLKKEYQFTKFADMPSIYFSDAIAYLQNIIDEIKRTKHLPLYLYYQSELEWVK